MRKIFISIALVLVSFVSAFAHDGINKECNLAIRVTPGKADPEYEKGEFIQLRILVYPLDRTQKTKIKTNDYTIKVVTTKDYGKREEKNYPMRLDHEFIHIATMQQNGFVRFEVFVQNKDGKNIEFYFGGFKRQKAYDGGAGVGLDNLKQAIEEPADFDEFWAKQKKMLADTPIKYTIKDAPIKHEKLDVYYVEVECPNSRPATGILTVPKDKTKKYSAMGIYDGYSNAVNRNILSWVPTDKIVFHVNAHGYHMDKDDAYYKEIQKSLSGYAFKNEENMKPETAYFYGMALRCMRSLQFLKQHSLYDGVNLEVQGGSQGGLQTIWCASLDHDVKIARPDIPWCADLGGYTKGRLRGWRPDYQKGLDYYDIVNHAKRIPETCFVHITRAGLGDYVCPPSGITIFYNNLKCPKKITYVHDSDHGYVNQGSLRFEKESK
ncbi:MAG: acetylxylan esterase [Lentisphaeria bacterium]|nr:acetylxylan esterase [Lentisphaeria bacterium]